MSVEFWSHTQTGNKNFTFKGPYNDPATKEVSMIAQRAAERKNGGSEASSSVLSSSVAMDN